MATKRVFVVFILPVIFSLVFGSIVMNDILQKPGRDLNMWPMSSSEGFSSHDDDDAQIEIVGLSKQYSTSEPEVEIRVKVNDPSFECGDLYVTIYASGKNDVLTQSGFLEQCFEKGNQIIPVNDNFSKVIDTNLVLIRLVTEMVSKDLKTILLQEERLLLNRNELVLW